MTKSTNKKLSSSVVTNMGQARSGRSRVKMDGQDDLNWMVVKSESGKSKSKRLSDLK